MRTIKTSKKHTYTVDLIYGPTFDGTVMIQLRDDRRLPKIAGEFDGLTAIDVTEGSDVAFPGYDTLALIARSQDGTVQLKIAKGGSD